MSEPEFDRFAERYDQILTEAIPGAQSEDAYFAEYKVALIASRLRGAKPRRILDFGCGAGRSLVYLDRYFPDSDLWGYDPSSASLGIAAGRVPRARLFADWTVASGMGFDVVLVANVLHHIPRHRRASALSQCRGVLGACGRVFLFEHNPNNPATRWIFDRCPFDKDAEMISLRSALLLARTSGFCALRFGYTLFFPRPLSRLRPLEGLLRYLPLGAQYFVEMRA